VTMKITSSSAVVLPTKKSQIAESLSDYTILLYGAKKIGKTTLCAEFPNPFFICTEPGTKALSVLSYRVRVWREMQSIIKQLTERDSSDPYCETVIVDTVDMLYEIAFDSVCKEHAIDHPSDEKDFGKTWREIKTKFSKAIVDLASLQHSGLILISHDTEKEITVSSSEMSEAGEITFSTDTTERVQPTMGKQALGEVEGLVDIIAHYGYRSRERVISIRGDEHLMAGSRLQKNFSTVAGKPVIQIPCGKSPKEAYTNLISAFNGKQATVDGSPIPHKKPIVLLKKGARV